MEDASLKVVFSEILRGFTLVDSHDYGKIRVKHFTNFDSAELDIKNKLFDLLELIHKDKSVLKTIEINQKKHSDKNVFEIVKNYTSCKNVET